MVALPQTLTLLCQLDPEGLQVRAEEQAHLTQQLIQALLKQAVERIARLREVSLLSLRLHLALLLGLVCSSKSYVWRCLG